MGKTRRSRYALYRRTEVSDIITQSTLAEQGFAARRHGDSHKLWPKASKSSLRKFLCRGK